MKLYVGNLPYETTDADLKALFSDLDGEAVEVASASVIIDRETGRSKGFGFVEYTNDDQARKAMEKYNGFQLGARALVVNEARPREERPRTGGGFGGGSRGGDRGGFSGGSRGGDRGGFGGGNRY